MRTPRFRLHLLASVLPPPSVTALAPPLPPRLLQLLPSDRHDPQRRPTQATYHRSSTRPRRSKCIPSNTSNTSCPACPLFTGPTQLKTGIKHAMGEQVTIRLNEVTSLGGGFRTSGLLEEQYPHPCPDPVSAVTAVEIERAAHPRGRGRHALH